MPFIGRPNLPEQLATLATQIRARTPTGGEMAAGAVGGIAGTIGDIAQEKMKLRAKRDLIDYLQKQLDLRASKQRAAEATKLLAGQGRLEAAGPGFSTEAARPTGMAMPWSQADAAAPPAGRYALSGLLEAMRAPAGMGAGFYVTPPRAKEAAPDIVELNDALIAKLKPVMDLSAYKGQQFRLGTINSLVAELERIKQGGAAADPARKLAFQAAFREQMELQEQVAMNAIEKESIPDFRGRVDYYEEAFRNKDAETPQRSLSDIFAEILLKAAVEP